MQRQRRYIEKSLRYARECSASSIHTLTSMNNLAGVLGKRGDYATAAKMHRETLLLLEKVLGKEHPHTLASMNNLARVLDRPTDYAAAEKTYR